MPYITVKDTPQFKQISMEDLINELLAGYVEPERFTPKRNAPSSTRTYFHPSLTREMEDKCDVTRLTLILRAFCERHQALYEVPDRARLYLHYEIPKDHPNPETGIIEMRPIDAPKPELKQAQYELKSILENEFGALYHTSAFAYIPNRCCVDSVRRHQANQSWWFLKTDFSNFFGSTTPEFVHSMLRMIYPFSELYKYPAGEAAMVQAMDLCFLNGGLPQGTPISPMLTNLMMIPIDHRLANTLTKWTDGKHYVYTRYADDILISSKYKFDYDKVVSYINDTLRSFHAPFAIKDSKTRFGSRNGHNVNLGVVLNAQNEITIGHKKKESFRGMLTDYIRAKQSHESWPLPEVQSLYGLYTYYANLEPDFWNRTIDRMNRKYRCDLVSMMKEDVSGRH